MMAAVGSVGPGPSGGVAGVELWVLGTATCEQGKAKGITTKTMTGEGGATQPRQVPRTARPRRCRGRRSCRHGVCDKGRPPAVMAAVGSVGSGPSGGVAGVELWVLGTATCEQG